MTESPLAEGHPACPCDHTQLRRRVTASGAVTFGEQCLTCGRRVAPVRGSQVADPHAVPAWDDSLHGAYCDARNQALQAHWQARQDAYQRQQGEKDRAWRQDYEDYLQTPAWAALRRKVFERCNGVCEGCRERRAVQVHHLTYKRLGREMLFDLAAVCLVCHEAIHPHMRST